VLSKKVVSEGQVNRHTVALKLSVQIFVADYQEVIFLPVEVAA
jgi:hypothetical protein